MSSKQKSQNVYGEYMDRRFQEMAMADAYDNDDRQAVTVRLPIHVVRKIDFLAKKLELSRQVFLDDLIGMGVSQAQLAYVDAHAEGEYRDRARSELAELHKAVSQELWAQVQEGEE